MFCQSVCKGVHVCGSGCAHVCVCVCACVLCVFECVSVYGGGGGGGHVCVCDYVYALCIMHVGVPGTLGTNGTMLKMLVMHLQPFAAESICCECEPTHTHQQL